MTTGPAAMTTAEALRQAERRLALVGIDDARIEAEALFRHALSIPRERLYAGLRNAIDANELARYQVLLLRRIAHEPLAYISGHREFYGFELQCTPDALIPRPETELLVELALAWCRENPDVPYPTLVDVGTGTGAIAIAIAVHEQRARVVATDVSPKAIELARRNARAHGVDGRIDFIVGDLLSRLRRPVDVIVANLPYIPDDVYAALPPEIHREPSVALRAGKRGTETIERLLAQSSALVRPGGLLLIEHAWDQGERLREIAKASFPRARVETKRDLSGHERVLVVHG